MTEDGFVEVRYLGGSHDGAVYPLPAEWAVMGREQSLPPRHLYATPEAVPPAEPTAMLPDESWERYVLQRDDEGWAFEYAGTLGDE